MEGQGDPNDVGQLVRAFDFLCDVSGNIILLHGTTRMRGEQILKQGPDARFQEPGGQADCEGLPMCVEAGPFLFCTPGEYARGKAVAFPGEGGAVILIVEVPDESVGKAINDWFPVSQGLIQFDPDAGLEELLAAWQALKKRIVELSDE